MYDNLYKYGVLQVVLQYTLTQLNGFDFSMRQLGLMRMNWLYRFDRIISARQIQKNLTNHLAILS
jgi:hypothetical protein